MALPLAVRSPDEAQRNPGTCAKLKGHPAMRCASYGLPATGLAAIQRRRLGFALISFASMNSSSHSSSLIDSRCTFNQALNSTSPLFDGGRATFCPVFSPPSPPLTCSARIPLHRNTVRGAPSMLREFPLSPLPSLRRRGAGSIVFFLNFVSQTAI